MYDVLGFGRRYQFEILTVRGNYRKNWDFVDLHLV